MGALGGSLSYMRFLVDGEAPKNPGAAFEKAFESRRFTPLNPVQEAAESAGWVVTEAPFDDELAITRGVFLFGDLVVISYREDKWAIPKPVLKRETQKRIQQIIDEEKKDPETIGKAFVKAVQESVLVQLKQKTLPRSKIIDVVWDMAKGEARVFGRGTVVSERLASLFERTFQVRVDVGPWAARAFRLDLGSRAMGVLERLSPGWLFPDPMRAIEEGIDEALTGAGVAPAIGMPKAKASTTAAPTPKASDFDTPPWEG